MMRINKFLASCGIASRRNADKLIQNGEISVNGEIVKTPGIDINIDKDIVKYKNKILKIIEDKLYFMLNKPIGYTCTNTKNFDKNIIFDLIDTNKKLFSIGRLDKDSRGLILITNDGEIYNNIIHPKNKIWKTYIVSLDKNLIENHRKILENGVNIGEYITQPSKVKILNNKKIEISIKEGKNRQIRKMLKALNYKVLDLNRISIGKIKLDDLKIGKYRKLKNEEIEYLKNI